jgi:hypothetical protein
VNNIILIAGLIFYCTIGISGEHLNKLIIEDKEISLSTMGWDGYKTDKLGTDLTIIENIKNKKIQGYYTLEYQKRMSKKSSLASELKNFCGKLNEHYSKDKLGFAREMIISEKSLCYMENQLKNNDLTVQYLYPAHFNQGKAVYQVHVFTFTIDKKIKAESQTEISKLIQGMMQ